jgi:hypothetical protein
MLTYAAVILVNDSSLHIEEVSMTPLNMPKRCQLHHYATKFVVYLREGSEALFFFFNVEI